MTCDERAGSFHFVATGYQIQDCVPEVDEPDPTSLSPRLEADVDITTIAAEDSADDQRISAITSRHLDTAAPPCEDPDP